MHPLLFESLYLVHPKLVLRVGLALGLAAEGETLREVRLAIAVPSEVIDVRSRVFFLCLLRSVDPF